MTFSLSLSIHLYSWYLCFFSDFQFLFHLSVVYKDFHFFLFVCLIDVLNVVFIIINSLSDCLFFLSVFLYPVVLYRTTIYIVCVCVFCCTFLYNVFFFLFQYLVWRQIDYDVIMSLLLFFPIFFLSDWLSLCVFHFIVDCVYVLLLTSFF